MFNFEKEQYLKLMKEREMANVDINNIRKSFEDLTFSGSKETGVSRKLGITTSVVVETMNEEENSPNVLRGAAINAFEANYS